MNRFLFLGFHPTILRVNERWTVKHSQFFNWGMEVMEWATLSCGIWWISHLCSPSWFWVVSGSSSWGWGKLYMKQTCPNSLGYTKRLYIYLHGAEHVETGWDKENSLQFCTLLVASELISWGWDVKCLAGIYPHSIPTPTPFHARSEFGFNWSSKINCSTLHLLIIYIDVLNCYFLLRMKLLLDYESPHFATTWLLIVTSMYKMIGRLYEYVYLKTLYG